MSEMIGETPQPKSSEVVNNYQQERIRSLEKAVPEEALQRVDAITEMFKENFLTLLVRANNDPDIVDIMYKLNAAVNGQVNYGGADTGLAVSRQEELKENLLGAALVINPATELSGKLTYGVINTPHEAEMINRFVERTSRLRGKELDH